LKLKCDILLSNFAFKFNLRRHSTARVWDPRQAKEVAVVRGRGLHSSTSQLNLSRFYILNTLSYPLIPHKYPLNNT